MRTFVFLVLVVLGSTASFAQTPIVREDPSIYGRPGWVIRERQDSRPPSPRWWPLAEVRLVSANPRLSIHPLFVPDGNGYMVGAPFVTPWRNVLDMPPRDGIELSLRDFHAIPGG